MSFEKDYLIRAYSSDLEVRVFAATSRNLVEKARKLHNSSPIGTAALGRLMTALTMMGAMEKNKETRLTLEIIGNGPLKCVIAAGDAKGNVRGYVGDNNIVLPPNAAGHLNVGGAIGAGHLTVIRDYGLKEPYISTINLHSGEIAEDLTYYFAESEQTPSVVGLGVLLSKENRVLEAGGFILQLMPGCSEETISLIERNIQGLPNVTKMLSNGNSPESIVEILLKGKEVIIGEKQQIQWHCNCSKAKTLRLMASLSESDLEEMQKEGKKPMPLKDFLNGIKH